MAAKCLGDTLVVIVNGDGFLRRKKSFAFMEEAERCEVVASLRGVDHVLLFDDGTQHVDAVVRALRPKVFAKGGDRRPGNLAAREVAACLEVNCELICGVGGYDKAQSSSALAARLRV